MNLTDRQKNATFPTTTVYPTNARRRKHAWESPCPRTENPYGWRWDTDKAVQSFKETTLHGEVIRWNSNGSVPPADCLGDWYDLGLLTDVQLEQSTAAREKDTAQFLDNYRQQNQGRRLSAEEQFELRANFEPGTTVMDVVTGQRFRV